MKRITSTDDPQHSHAPTYLRVIWWLITAFLAGESIMSLEMAAFRLFAPYFGYSIYVWGSMISVVMAALAIGYALGGFIADRSRSDAPLYVIVLGSGLYQLLIAVWSHELLSYLSQLDVVAASTLATVAVFSPPMIALATVSPFVVRLLARFGRVGTASGAVYAISTVGSIVGVLVTTFLVIPEFGTRVSLLIACGTTAAVGLIGLWRKSRLVVVLIVPLVSLSCLQCSSPTPSSPETIWLTESEYNYIRVDRRGSVTNLILNSSSAVQSLYVTDDRWTSKYYDDFALGPLLVPGRRLLVLGMGAGSSITATRKVAPEVEIDAVEIDPKVIEAAHRFFNLEAGSQNVDKPKLRIYVDDARAWIGKSQGSYDIVHLDIYQGGFYAPFYLLTLEFYDQIRARMSDDGVLIVNLFDPGTDRELLHSTAATLARVFPSLAVRSRWANHVVFASTRSRSIESIRQQLNQLQHNAEIREFARDAASQMVALNPPPGTATFTDDHAPIERITRRMLREAGMK